VTDSGPAVIRLSGEHDISTRDELRLAFQASRENPRVIVDLIGVDYLDSTAIGEIARAVEHTSHVPDGRVVIVARNQRLVRLLSIAGLTASVPIVDTERDAVALLQSG